MQRPQTRCNELDGVTLRQALFFKIKARRLLTMGHYSRDLSKCEGGAWADSGAERGRGDLPRRGGLLRPAQRRAASLRAQGAHASLTWMFKLSEDCTCHQILRPCRACAIDCCKFTPVQFGTVRLGEGGAWKEIVQPLMCYLQYSLSLLSNLLQVLLAHILMEILGVCEWAGYNVPGRLRSGLQLEQQQAVWPAELWGTAGGPLPAAALPGPLPHEGGGTASLPSTGTRLLQFTYLSHSNEVLIDWMLPSISRKNKQSC